MFLLLYCQYRQIKLAKMKSYINNEIIESMRSKIEDQCIKVGRQVKVIGGEYAGIRGIVQDKTYDQNKPLKEDKVRVWLDGHSCLDIFDFNIDNLELIPLTYHPGMGYC